ncbi:hypothetical protein D3C76_1175110 [compost metagenome]
MRDHFVSEQEGLRHIQRIDQFDHVPCGGGQAPILIRAERTRKSDQGPVDPTNPCWQACLTVILPVHFIIEVQLPASPEQTSLQSGLGLPVREIELQHFADAQT